MGFRGGFASRKCQKRKILENSAKDGILPNFSARAAKGTTLSFYVGFLSLKFKTELVQVLAISLLHNGVNL